ncbi:MAG: DUF2791 family P-loop domain-containing protein [Chloroflexi bacterium]|nr:DUF2791 family P-loop domain-containing protein [Chloroflexota bacterium]
MEIRSGEWIGLITREYLADFIDAGGAAVKVAVAGDAHGRATVRDALQTSADASGYQFAFVDASVTKVQLIDRLFHAVARQIDWERLARAFLARVLANEGYRLPESERGLTLAAIAGLNDLPERGLHIKIESLLWDALFRDYAMTQEFRLAMVRLCRAQLYPDDEPAVTEAVLEWLRGDLRRISALKKALIFQKVARHNARDLLASLSHWLKRAGQRGLVLVVDIARCAEVVPRSERDEGVYYSRPATFDVYETLRELIDGVDQAEASFVVVLAGPDFVTDQRRGLTTYPALYYRLASEVHDEYRPNPLAALVRVATDG